MEFPILIGATQVKINGNKHYHSHIVYLQQNPTF